MNQNDQITMQNLVDANAVLNQVQKMTETQESLTVFMIQFMTHQVMSTPIMDWKRRSANLTLTLYQQKSQKEIDQNIITQHVINTNISTTMDIILHHHIQLKSCKNRKLGHNSVANTNNMLREVMHA